MNEAEIREALRSVMTEMKQPKPNKSSRGKSVSQSRVKQTKPRVDSYTGVDENGFRTYIRSNTISNIADVDEEFEQNGVTGQLERTRIDITSHEVPSKKVVKRAAGQKKIPTNRVF